MPSSQTPKAAPRVPRQEFHAAQTVSPGVRVAAAWIWRLLLVAVGIYALGWLISRFSGVSVPLAIGVLLAALLMPAKNLLARVLPSVLATAVTIIVGLTMVIAALGGIVAQIVSEGDQLVASAQEGLRQLVLWITEGPLDVAPADLQAEIDAQLAMMPERFEELSGDILAFVVSLGSSVGSFFTGLFVMLFALIFFLHNGRGIWMGLVKLVPRAARPAVDTGVVAGWKALGGYVRTTVLVAFIDAVGILIGALVLGVPMAGAIAALTFLGAFVPIIGAVAAGFIGVLIALVTKGWVTALIFLGVILLVQQIEGNVLQPFLMGKAVSLHPLVILLGISVGGSIAGIVGAVVVVPIIAVIKAFVESLVSKDWLKRSPAPDLELSRDEIIASNELGGGSQADLEVQLSDDAPSTADLQETPAGEEDPAAKGARAARVGAGAHRAPADPDQTDPDSDEKG